MSNPRTYPQPDDDPAFLALVDRITDAVVKQYSPADVFIVRIKNFFDHKWLRFSGMGRVAVDTGFPGLDVALDEFHDKNLTFPPFTPSRVLAQYYFGLTTKKYYEEQAPPYLIHDQERKHSAANLHRHVKDFSGSAVYLWFSSNTAKNQQGSLMVYLTHEEQIDSWFASFHKKHTWTIKQVRGINRDYLDEIVD